MQRDIAECTARQQCDTIPSSAGTQTSHSPSPLDRSLSRLPSFFPRAQFPTHPSSPQTNAPEFFDRLDAKLDASAEGRTGLFVHPVQPYTEHEAHVRVQAARKQYFEATFERVERQQQLLLQQRQIDEGESQGASSPVFEAAVKALPLPALTKQSEAMRAGGGGGGEVRGEGGDGVGVSGQVTLSNPSSLTQLTPAHPSPPQRVPLHMQPNHISRLTSMSCFQVPRPRGEGVWRGEAQWHAVQVAASCLERRWCTGCGAEE